jgi:primosomal protein N' (replication factor Y)
VLAPLGRRAVTGYLVETRDHAPVADTKELCEILDAEPLLDAHLLALTRWVADYYMCPWGEVIRTALPPGIDSFTRRVVRLTTAGQTAQGGNVVLRPGERELLDFLSGRDAAPITTLAKRWPNAQTLVRSLVQRALLAESSEVRPPRVRALSVAYCTLAPGLRPDTVSLPPRAAKQRAILEALVGVPAGLPRAEAAAGNPAALAALIRKGLVEVREVEVSRDPFAAACPSGDLPRVLAAAQTEALAVIREALEARRFAPILLHGVTGSGKTEVYLQAIEIALDRGRQALVLVPEISLTPLAAQRFLARFGSRVAVLHSGLKGGERFDAWRRIRSGGADIVVGARSAVFAPLPRLGILVLGSATPSRESFERAQAGRYRLIRLPERVESRPLPQVEIVDLRRVGGGERLLSPPLCDAIAGRLARGEQSLLFLNRRGFSTLLICEECGATLGCPHCSVSLTYHAARGRLRCHTCDFERRPPEQCPECRGARLRNLGFGTQQLEAAVRERFPKARVARMDRDTVGGWRAAERILDHLIQGEIDILVGTQMIGKGHDVPNVTLVGVVSADMALHVPDFRAGERAFALFTQVVGRAGRGDQPGLALIQTFNPDHYILRAVQSQDYAALWEAESPLRRDQLLPPFSRAILAILSSPQEKTSEAGAEEFARLLREGGVKPSGLSGPAPAPLYRVRSRYRWHILVRGQDGRKLHARVQEAARRLRASPAGRGVRLDLDVDPASVC